MTMAMVIRVKKIREKISRDSDLSSPHFSYHQFLLFACMLVVSTVSRCILRSGELESDASAQPASHWRCYRLPGSVPCLKDDSPSRPSWFYDVTTASCRVNPMSSCDVTDHVGNDFRTLDDCIRTCMPGELRFD